MWGRYVMIDHYFPSVTGFGQDIISYKKQYNMYIYIHTLYMRKCIHPGKFTWNTSSWRFGDDVSLAKLIIFRFQPLIFRGVWDDSCYSAGGSTLLASIHQETGPRWLPPSSGEFQAPPRNHGGESGMGGKGCGTSTPETQCMAYIPAFWVV